MWRKYIWGQGETKDDSIIQSALAKNVVNTTQEVSNTNYYMSLFSETLKYVGLGLTVSAVMVNSWRNISNNHQTNIKINEIKETCEELKTKIESKYDKHNVSEHLQNAWGGAKAGAWIGQVFGFVGSPTGAVLGALGAGITSAMASHQKDNSPK